MSRADVKTLLETTGFKAYPDYTPGSQDLPAMSYTWIAEPFRRQLNGVKTQKSERYRINVVAKNHTDLESLENALNLLDNTSDSVFQRVMLELQVQQPPDSESITLVSVYDLTVIRR